MKKEDIALMNFLEAMVNEKRIALIDKILEDRTRYLTIVLEDIYQPHNASAVLRTCDCFGIQDVHIIENRNSYELNPDVELGAAQWLTLHRYDQGSDNTEKALTKLKSEGYRLIATTPHTEETDLKDFDITAGKTAIMMGTEMNGLSEKALSMADEYLKIPMFGFTESFNISVSAAIILHRLQADMRRNLNNWPLLASEREIIRLKWIKNSVKNAALIERAFKKRYLP